MITNYFVFEGTGFQKYINSQIYASNPVKDVHLKSVKIIDFFILLFSIIILRHKQKKSNLLPYLESGLLSVTRISTRGGHSNLHPPIKARPRRLHISTFKSVACRPAPLVPSITPGKLLSYVKALLLAYLGLTFKIFTGKPRLRRIIEWLYSICRLS